MKPRKKTEDQKKEEKSLEVTLGELIEMKKLENSAYKKILKSLNSNKNQ